ncbi:MAG: hypothetical protein ABI861_05225 [Panacibacter sp.]
MNTINGKYTAKNSPPSLTGDYLPKPEKISKKQYMRFAGYTFKEISPELLEAHIIALMGNALS